ncbi:MAG TPA: N-acetylmuramoyl-L-alanine amidase, partial [Longimicrobiales bacterium]
LTTMTTKLRAGLLATTLTLAACGGGPEPERPDPRAARVPVPLSPETRSAELPATPYVDGPLDLSVVYPPAGARIANVDSTFIFGSTGTGDAALTINGHTVPVARNGAFLAFLPMPRDGVWRLAANTQSERDTLAVRIELVGAASDGVLETPTFVVGSGFPRGARVALEGEPIEVGFTGRRGGWARLVLPDGRTVPLEATYGTSALATYRGVMPAMRVNSGDTSVAWPTLGSELRPLTTSSVDRPAVFELILDGDTIRRPAPLNLLVLDPAAPRVGVVRDPRPLAERGDAQIIARPGPGSGPYEWFWPDGTELTITGEADGQYRVRLTDDLTVWSPADEIDVQPLGASAPASRVGDVNIRPAEGWVDVRIPISRRLPFRVFEGENRIGIEIYGATSRTNRIDYGTLDPFVERAEWEQPGDGLYRFTLHLNGWAWGHQVFHEDGRIVLRVRRPPPIDPDHPLAGRVIAIDAGHGGAASGAQGPTGLREADVTLAVARSLARQLEDAGARPVLIRNEDVDVALEERVARAVDAGAEMMLSIHMDAFPDGVNPYRNAGTHMFYFHPRAADLARNLQRELLDELALPDRGINRADLALARPTWMPSVLTETMFMMIPQWEAAMRDQEVIDRIARAHLLGIAGFLEQRAAEIR